MATTDRGVSVVLQYVLTLGVVTLLTTSLLVSMGGFVENRRDGVVHSELEVVGNRLAADLAAADRLARDGTTVRVRSDLPGRVAGAEYRIEVARVDDRRYELTLRSSDPDLTATVAFRSDTPVRETTVDGGSLRVVYDPDAGVLEVTHV